MTRLFLHQARAINAAMAGQHIVIATATSSGKSVVYNTPVLHVRTYGSVKIVWGGSGKVTEQRIITYIHILTNKYTCTPTPTNKTDHPRQRGARGPGPRAVPLPDQGPRAGS